MEKFGIFELLDALSALTARESAPEDKPAGGPPAQTEPPAAPKREADGAPADALAVFLARHEEMKKHIKK